MTSSDYLTYEHLNNIEQLIYDLAQTHNRNYTKTIWIMGQLVEYQLLENIENELSYYNSLYNLGYDMRDWSLPLQNISYLDINRWLDIIEQSNKALQNIIYKYAREIRTSIEPLEIINKEV